MVEMKWMIATKGELRGGTGSRREKHFRFKFDSVDRLYEKGSLGHITPSGGDECGSGGGPARQSRDVLNREYSYILYTARHNMVESLTLGRAKRATAGNR